MASHNWVTCRQPDWLLLHYCAATRANYLLRVLPPHLTEEYASSHDDAVASCLSSLLDLGEAPLPQPSLRAAQLAWRHGGLCLRSARADRHTAHWASWCDTLPVIHARAPAVAGWLLSALSRRPLPRLNLCSACGPMAMMRRHGLQSFGLTQRRVPAGPASLKLPFGVGSASLPERAMSARARHTLLTCRLRLVRCCSRSRGRILPGPSPPCRPMRPSSGISRHPSV